VKGGTRVWSGLRPGVRWACLAGLLLWCGLAGAWAADLDWVTGRVVSIHDGDTLKVWDGGQLHTVRLVAIDAPERRQAHSQRARQQLAAAVWQREVRVSYRKRDRYRRLVGQVWRDGEDVGLALVRGGWAWHYTAYQRDQSLADRLAYAVAEQEARQHRLGLWADDDPLPPWAFRRQARAARP
jgi:endonuclease YncB( thermonuclease family)